MPRFSVISPIYNTAPFLGRFIESVTAQTFGDLELILVDDGSSDDSLSICREYAARDNRIKVITQPNQGSGFARNNGIEHATGEYLLFWDSDDWAAINALEKIAEYLDEKTADLLIYGSEHVFLSNEGDELKRIAVIPQQLDLVGQRECRAVFCDLIFSNVLNVPWNKVYNRSFVMENRVRFADTRRAQDAFFNMEYFRFVGSLYTVPDVLYCYRANDAGKLWMKFPMDIYKIDVRYNRRLEEICKEFDIYTGKDRARVDRWFYNSILRDAGFYRNPLWKLSRKQKLAYVSEVISDEYNRSRAQSSPAPDKRTQSVRRRILNGDTRGLMFDIRRYYGWDGMYERYCDLKSKIKKET